MAHFSRATFAFLRDLAQNNDTTWFRAHRDLYDRHARDPASAVAAQWRQGLPNHYIGAGVAGRALAPPNRDTRFTRDKSPYRTRLLIRLRHRLALPGAPGPTFLLCVDPSGSFLSGGVRDVSGEARRRVVASIQSDPAAWLAAREGLVLDDDAPFATAPSSAPELAEDLHRRHFTAQFPLSQRVLCTDGLAKELAALSSRLLPLNEFLAEALYGERSVPVSP